MKYLPGQGPYTGEKNVFLIDQLVVKKDMNIYMRRLKRIKDIKVVVSSASWYFESLKATKKLIKKENASKVKIPVLLFQAEYDTYVIPRSTK